jgi:outer membrane protein TolC
MNDRATSLVGLMVVGTLAVCLWGCAVGPDDKPPTPDVPATGTGVTGQPPASPSVATATPARLVAWWQTFNATELTQLVEEACTPNLDVHRAEARWRQARAARDVAAGGLGPSVHGAASYDRIDPAANGGTTVGRSVDEHNKGYPD